MQDHPSKKSSPNYKIVVIVGLVYIVLLILFTSLFNYPI
jgi:hypothetical protein